MSKLSTLHLNNEDWEIVEYTINSIRNSFRRTTQAMSSQKTSIPYGYIVVTNTRHDKSFKDIKRKLNDLDQSRYYFVKNGYIAQAIGKHPGIFLSESKAGIPTNITHNFPDIRSKVHTPYFYPFDLEDEFNRKMTMRIVSFIDGNLIINRNIVKITYGTNTYSILEQLEEKGWDIELADYWEIVGDGQILSADEGRTLYKQIHSMLKDLNVKIKAETGIKNLITLEGKTIRLNYL